MAVKKPEKTQKEVLAEAEEAALSAEDIDGYYEINEKEEGIFLTVFPPKGKGFPVHLSKVEKELEILGTIDVDKTKIAETVAKKAGEKVLIAPSQAGRDKDANIEVGISEDKMKVSITAVPAKGKGQAITAEFIKEALQKSGVVHGIDEKAIKDLIDKETYEEAVQVASGTLPKPGEDGQIDYQFRTGKAEHRPTELKDGSVDFYNLDLVENVIEGQVVAIKMPPQAGTPGINVLGEEIPASTGKPVDFVLGKNVKISEEDASLLIATASGQAVLNDRQINVVELYVVRGDVDYATGNVTFVGGVKIGGNVRGGFEVKAGGNLEIAGIVENAKIEGGGNVSIRGGIFGQGKGEVDAEGDVKTKFVDGAIVKTKGSLIVNQAVLHSHITAGKQVVIAGKGVLVGGVTRAGEEVKARILGSELTVSTEIEVGINPTLKEDYFKLQESIKKTSLGYEKVTVGIKTLTIMRDHLKADFPPEKKAMLNKLVQAEVQLRSLLESSKSRLEELDKKMEEMKEGRIVVGERIYPGVKVTIGKSVRRFDEEVKNLRNNILKEKDGEIILV